MAAPRVVASTVSIPAVLVLHTDMAPFLEDESRHGVPGEERVSNKHYYYGEWDLLSEPSPRIST